MTYQHLPAIGSLGAPDLEYVPTNNQSSRSFGTPQIVFNHRWSGGQFDGILSWFKDPNAQASSHIVYAGEIGPDKGKAAQMVPWSQKAWTECSYNHIGLSIESADAIWLGTDPIGFARLARMTALLLHQNNLPARWVKGTDFLNGGRGHCRHADGGTLGCGHFSCPTTDLALFEQFHARVVAETRYGKFRTSEWGKK